jgi:hypothetical protein
VPEAFEPFAQSIDLEVDSIEDLRIIVIMSRVPGWRYRGVIAEVVAPQLEPDPPIPDTRAKSSRVGPRTGSLSTFTRRCRVFEHLVYQNELGLRFVSGLPNNRRSSVQAGPASASITGKHAEDRGDEALMASLA